jgi:hypothetical protein
MTLLLVATVATGLIYSPHRKCARAVADPLSLVGHEMSLSDRTLYYPRLEKEQGASAVAACVTDRPRQ